MSKAIKIQVHAFKQTNQKKKKTPFKKRSKSRRTKRERLIHLTI